jgi:hypothetical protein
MFDKKKKIIFKANDDRIFNIEEIPNPSSKHIPDWLAKEKKYSNGEQNVFKATKNWLRTGKPWHGTYKGCTPLLDSMTSGYTIVSQASFLVIRTIGEDAAPKLDWNTSIPIADLQAKEVLGKYPVPYGHNPNVFRWAVNWKIKTPPGYSLWVTHPAHRYDLPFTTITGFVDTDKHSNSLFLPFFIRDDFEGEIKQGTPIAQIIPVKRDSWKSEKQNFEPKDKYGEEVIRKYTSSGYRNSFWTKKDYN